MVKILTTQRCVAVRGLDFEHSARDLQNRDVESSSTKVIDSQDLTISSLVHAKGKSRCGWLVDDARDLETSDLSGVLRCLTLGVVEVGRHCDHRLAHGSAQVSFGSLLHLREHESADLAWSVLLTRGLDPGIAVRCSNDLVGQDLLVLLRGLVVVGTSDQALGGKDGVLCVCDRLTLGRNANQSLAIASEAYEGGRRSHTLRVLDDLGCGALHDGDAGVGGAQVYANYIALDGQADRGRAEEAAPGLTQRGPGGHPRRGDGRSHHSGEAHGER
mmetsp:Transcript_11231/g.21128  ORF Transcript_11231/g.21128 Transcript_11231/m.21128 type:complete len:273 (-) Transcript_11231:22-840(-)